ncbi:MAG TPA: sigma-70 family RNA polymerase sigma factor [Actinomycetota bacterium]|nr:sigma-70 family RNA polymerase sigma factor [Actinomycetota bacterium]
MATLYGEVIAPAQRFAYLLCANGDDAAELAQEAFVKAYARVSHLEDPSAVQAYLRKTIVNLVRGRGRKRRVERVYAHLFEQRHDTAARAQEVPDDALWCALDRLSTRQRAALVLRYYMDFSEQQTAETLGCSVPAVKSLTARGMRILRSALEEAPDDAR